MISPEHSSHPTDTLDTTPSLSPPKVVIEEHAPGVFAIPETTETSDKRPGASLASWTEFDQGSEDHELSLDLPMVVWLRGDEAWYPQFDLDADAVMQRLGIKRSRLTQISGKELRVGRVRMDRYVRPIYRSADVEQYSNWTRATASHQKSSSALKEAVDALQSQGSQIAQVVEAANQSFKNAIEAGLADKVRDAAVESVATVKNQLDEFDHRVQDALLILQTGINDSYKNLSSAIIRHGSIAETQANITEMRLDALEAASAATVLRLAEMSDKMERLWGQQSQIERYLQQHLLTMESVLTTVKQLAASDAPNFKRKRTKAIKSPRHVDVTQPPTVSQRTQRLRQKHK